MPTKMRLFPSTVLGLLFCVSSMAIGADETSSADERAKAKVYFGAEGGSAIVPFLTGGAVVGAYLGPDWLINANYSEGGAKVDDVEIKWNFTEVRAKRFFGNSLFLNFGIGQRRFAFADDAPRIGGGEDVRLRAESMTTGLSVSVGNQWHWKNFSFGCDWIGGYVPLGRRSSAPKDNANVEDKDQKDIADLYDALAEKPHLSALRVQLGVSF